MSIVYLSCTQTYSFSIFMLQTRNHSFQRIFLRFYMCGCSFRIMASKSDNTNTPMSSDSFNASDSLNATPNSREWKKREEERLKKKSLGQVPCDCDKPLQEMSRNRLYRRACRVAYPTEMWAAELSWDSGALPAAFGQRNMDENAFKTVRLL